MHRSIWVSICSMRSEWGQLCDRARVITYGSGRESRETICYTPARSALKKEEHRKQKELRLYTKTAMPGSDSAVLDRWAQLLDAIASVWVFATAWIAKTPIYIQNLKQVSMSCIDGGRGRIINLNTFSIAQNNLMRVSWNWQYIVYDWSRNLIIYFIGRRRVQWGVLVVHN